MITGYVTYYWQSASHDALQAAITTSVPDGNGNTVLVNSIDNLGIAEGNAEYGDVGIFYTCTRSPEIIETPLGCSLAEPFVVSHLLGVWA